VDARRATREWIEAVCQSRSKSKESLGRATPEKELVFQWLEHESGEDPMIVLTWEDAMRGAAFLSKRDEALVIDVGGTTTDIGSLRHGFPREANNVVEIGGVRTLFRMPDLLSMGLGGGTIISKGGGAVTVGPASVGYRLTEQALVIERGRIAHRGASRELLADQRLLERYVGVSATDSA